MASSVPTETITMADGRTISYSVYGVRDPTPSTVTIFYFHGFPASRAEASLFDPAAKAHNIRLVAPDRPGMGRSTLQPGRALTDWPRDVLALADSPTLRADTFGVLGVSGGAAYVLACCAALPPARLRAAGILSGLYPARLGLAGMLPESRALLWVAPWATGLVGTLLDWSVGAAARDAARPERLGELLRGGMKGRPEADRRAVEDNEAGIRDALEAGVRGAVGEPETGARGAAWELRLFGSPWGFELEDVHVERGRLVLWHGARDVNAPLAMAEKAAALLDGAELRVEAEEAHVSLCAHKTDEVMKTLRERMA